MENKTDTTHLELHRAPLRWLAVPARVHVVGFQLGDADRRAIKERFSTLAEAFGLSESNIIWHNTNAFGRDSA